MSNIDKEWYKEFQKLTHEKTYKEVTKKMKDIKEIGDIGLHAKVEFDDDKRLVLIHYFREDTILTSEAFTYDEFVELFE